MKRIRWSNPKEIKWKFKERGVIKYGLKRLSHSKKRVARNKGGRREEGGSRSPKKFGRLHLGHWSTKGPERNKKALGS